MGESEHWGRVSSRQELQKPGFMTRPVVSQRKGRPPTLLDRLVRDFEWQGVKLERK